MNKSIVNIVLAVSFLVVANVQADLVVNSYTADLVWLNGGTGASFSTVTTSSIDGGVVFSFNVSSVSTNKDVKVDAGEYYLYGLDGMFDTTGLIEGGNPRGAGNNNFWTNQPGPEYTWTHNAAGENGKYGASELPVEMTLLYADRDMTWETFVEWLSASDFAIGYHDQSVDKGGSGFFATGKWTAVQPGDGNSSETPEPATLAIFGLGLVGLALARRRMTK